MHLRNQGFYKIKFDFHKIATHTRTIRPYDLQKHENLNRSHRRVFKHS